MGAFEAPVVAGAEAQCEIPPFRNRDANLTPSSGARTVPGGQFDWGGRLLKSNGGAPRFAQGA